MRIYPSVFISNEPRRSQWLYAGLLSSLLIAGCNNAGSPNPTQTSDDQASQAHSSTDADGMTANDSNQPLSKSPEPNRIINSNQQSDNPDAASSSQGSFMITSDDTSMGAVLIGDYTGNLPCSDCDNIRVLLNLYADGSSKKTMTYQPIDSAHPPKVKLGTYRQDNDIIIVSYDEQGYAKDNVEKYLIQDSQLVMLGHDPDADELVSSDYILTRE